MNERELREIKRRFRPDRCNIPAIRGCFVNENKQILSRINQSLALSGEDSSERLLGTMKKALSGTLGTNLIELSFRTSDVESSEEHKLVMRLRASGLSDDAIRECVKRGICKVNFATELRQAYTRGVREALSDESVFDPKVYGKAGKEKVKALVIDRIRVCGSFGKA